VTALPDHIYTPEGWGPKQAPGPSNCILCEPNSLYRWNPMAHPGGRQP